MKSNRAPSKALQVIRWSLIADLFWLSSTQLPLPPALDNEAGSGLTVVLTLALLLGSRFFIVSDEIWKKKLERFRSQINSRAGGVVVGLFAAGIAFEIGTYLSQVFSLTLTVRTVVAILIGGVAAVTSNQVLFLKLPEDRTPVPPILIATLLIRFAALTCILIAPGIIRYLAWGACVINLPRAQQRA